MKLIIEIPDHIYEHAKNRSEDSNDEYEAMRAIAKGQEERPHGEWIRSLLQTLVDNGCITAIQANRILEGR